MAIASTSAGSSRTAERQPECRSDVVSEFSRRLRIRGRLRPAATPPYAGSFDTTAPHGRSLRPAREWSPTAARRRGPGATRARRGSWTTTLRAVTSRRHLLLAAGADVAFDRRACHGRAIRVAAPAWPGGIPTSRRGCARDMDTVTRMPPASATTRHGSTPTVARGSAATTSACVVTDGATVNVAPSATVSGVHVDNHAAERSTLTGVGGSDECCGARCSDCHAPSIGSAASGVHDAWHSERSPAGAHALVDLRRRTIAGPLHRFIRHDAIADGRSDLGCSSCDGATVKRAESARVAECDSVDNHAPGGTLDGAAEPVLRPRPLADLMRRRATRHGGSGVRRVNVRAPPSPARDTVRATHASGGDITTSTGTARTRHSAIPADGPYVRVPWLVDEPGRGSQMLLRASSSTGRDRPRPPRSPTHTAVPERPGVAGLSLASTIRSSPCDDQPSAELASGIGHYDVYRNGAHARRSTSAHSGGAARSPGAMSRASRRLPPWAPTPTRTPLSPSTLAGNSSVRVAGHGHHDRHGAVRSDVLDAHLRRRRISGRSVVGRARPTRGIPARPLPGVPQRRPPRERARHDVHRQHAGAAATTPTPTRSRRRTSAMRHCGVASAPRSPVLYDTTAPATPAGVAAGAALDGSVDRQLVGLERRRGSGVARYVVRRSLSSTPPASVSDGDATCQGTATVVHRRDDAQRQALHLCGVRNRPRGQHVAGRRLGGGDRARPARARPAEWPRRDSGRRERRPALDGRRCR